MTLRVLLVTEGYGASRYGVAKVVEQLNRRISTFGVEVMIAAASVEDANQGNRQVFIAKLPNWVWTRTLRFHLRQASALSEVVSEFQPDVIHVHGVLVPLQRAAVACALKRKIPVLVSVHGMLEPWLWRQRGAAHYWLKRLYWNVLMKPVIKHATYVHAITRQEADTLSLELPNSPQILIPNAIDLAEFGLEQHAPDSERYILFLGRIHPKKGVELLISAFSELKVSGYRLLIAGSEHSVEYTSLLREMVRVKNLQDRVSFLGGVFGERKLALLAKAWIVAVPSYSDVMALVNLEAAASFTPTITTTMTGLSDWAESGGLLIEPDVVQLKRALEEALCWSEEDRLAKGLQSRQFVADKYSWDVVGKRWMDTYQKIASGVHP